MATSEKLAALLADLRSRGDNGTAEGACVEAIKFLDGNSDESSLGCNLDEHPGMDEFRRVVAAVSERSDVSGMYVCIQEDMGDEEFPFTDAILVCTSADPAELKAAFASLSPDDVFKTTRGITVKLPKSRDGHRWVTVWWD